MARLRYVTRQQVEFIAHELAAKLFADYEDPLPAFQLLGGEREGTALLESALGSPRQRFYPRLHDKAAVLLRSLIKNHPLVDGNKRIAMTATFVFLAMNGTILLASNREMVSFALKVATQKPDMTWEEIAAWLRERTIDAAASDKDLDARIRGLPDTWRDEARARSRLAEYLAALDEATQE